ncbi:hypothetical protein [Paraburkholderia adhaesiva]|uniref:hypothetical protein n=1 Tax=Paraburkholderia adhaesiva TaxID=2883244 RepID=UPI001F46877C|nr:hypothetical protein [Paraburkholderia adhaesiva]
MSSSAYRRVIESAATGKKFHVLQLVRRDPETAAMLAKLVPSTNPPQYNQEGQREITQPNLYEFRNAAEQTARNVNDAETVMGLLPDMELAQQVLVASIGSPKDMMSIDLTFTPPEGLMPPDVSGALIDRYRRHFEQVHKIKALIPEILRAALFRTGSYPIAVIPENSVDAVINGEQRLSMEALSEHIYADGTIRPLGVLGPVQKSAPTEQRMTSISAESFADWRFNGWESRHVGQVRFELGFTQPLPQEDVFLSVTDNPTVLKIPEIKQKIRERRILESLKSPALEAVGYGREMSIAEMNDRELTGVLYRNRQYGYQPIASVKTQEQLTRRTVGSPLTMHIPSEAVIPVHVPGTPEHQVGFFVLLDMEGHPIVRQAITDSYQQMTQQLNTGGSFPSAMINKVKSQMEGFNFTNRESLDYSARVYGDMIEQDLLARLRNGVYGSGVEIARREEVYRVMFARALAKQNSQLLFIPAEFMTYFAFRFNENGIGESLLDEIRILNGLRTTLLFSNVMAGVRNSIARTDVKIKLDEEDPNPEKTMETIMNETARLRSNQMPVGISSPYDVLDFIARAGFNFVVEGHPGYPDVNIDFGEKNTSYAKPDTDLEDNLRKRALMKVGTPPELIDTASQPEFATSIVTSNTLMSKRVMQLQDEFHPQLAAHMRIHAMNTAETMADLKQILRDNFTKLKFSKEDRQDARQYSHTPPDRKAEVPVVTNRPELPAGDKNVGEQQKEYLVEQILVEFLMNVEVSLPRPNSSTLENQVTALETYTKALEAGLEAWISEKFFNVDTAGDVAAKIETLKEVAKAYFVRLYMIENGMLPELAQLTTMDEDGKPLVDVFKMQTEHIEQLQKAFGDFFKGLLPITNRANEKFKTVQDKSTTEATDSYSSSSDTSGGEDYGFGGGGGEGDMGGGEMPDFGGGGGFGGPESGEGEGETAPTPSEFGSGAERGEATSHEPEEPEKGEKEEEDEEERRRGDGDENSGSSI